MKTTDDEKRALTDDEIRVQKKRQKTLKRKLKVKQKKEEKRRELENNQVSPVKQSEKEIMFDIGDVFDKLVSQVMFFFFP